MSAVKVDDKESPFHYGPESYYELGAKVYSYSGPMRAKGTPFALHWANRMNASKWIVRLVSEDANGRKVWKKDEALTTELHHRFGDRGRFDVDNSTKEIADWLREVWAKEQIGARTQSFEALVGGGRLVEKMRAQFDWNKAPEGSRVRVTIERLDK